jgi:hypothetical protein
MEPALLRSPERNPAMLAVRIAHEHYVAADLHAAYVAQQHAMNTVGAILADQPVGVLSDALARALSLPTVIRQVLLSYNGMQHILREHEISVAKNPNVVLQRISEALAAPGYVRQQREARRWEVVGFSADAARLVCVAIKFVPSASSRSGLDELWALTAFFVGARTLEKAARSSVLQPFEPSRV